MLRDASEKTPLSPRRRAPSVVACTTLDSRFRGNDGPKERGPRVVACTTLDSRVRGNDGPRLDSRFRDKRGSEVRVRNSFVLRSWVRKASEKRPSYLRKRGVLGLIQGITKQPHLTLAKLNPDFIKAQS